MEDAAAGAGPATRRGAMGVAPPTLPFTATPLVIAAGDALEGASGMLLLLLPPPAAVVAWRPSLISLSHALQSLDLCHYVHLVATTLSKISRGETIYWTNPFSSSIVTRAVVHCEFPGR